MSALLPVTAAAAADDDDDDNSDANAVTVGVLILENASSVSAASVWKSLSCNCTVRSAELISTFRCNLKLMNRLTSPIANVKTTKSLPLCVSDTFAT